MCVCGSACKQFGSLNWQTGLSPDLGTWPESTRKCWRAHSGHRVISSLVLHTCRFHIKYAGTPSVRSCCSCRTKVMREPLHPRHVATAGMTVTEIEANEATAIEATEPTEGKVKGHLALALKARRGCWVCLAWTCRRKGKGKAKARKAPLQPSNQAWRDCSQGLPNSNNCFVALPSQDPPGCRQRERECMSISRPHM